jgi:hypothetical protein
MYLKIRNSYWILEIIQYYSTPDATYFGSDIAVELTGHDISRLVRAYEYCTQIWATNPEASPLEVLLAPRIGNRQGNWSLSFERSGIMLRKEELFGHARTIAGITLASSCYGGLHLIAWASIFHSHVALVLWRAASVTILATGPFFVVTGALFAGFDWVSRNHISLILDDILFWPPVCLSLLFIVWYTLCRTFIFVECFILLAHIPESTLRVPTWAAYIPSFG